MRSQQLERSGEDADRVSKSASGTAKYTLHQRVIAHSLGFGPDDVAPRLMSAFWESEWAQEAEQTYRELMRLRYELSGRIDVEETSIWARIFAQEADDIRGSLGVGYLHCR